jgi:hypothetical protein
MGIAELKPRQLAPTVGTTGSGSTGSPALSSSSTTCRSHLIISSAQAYLVFINSGGASDLHQHSNGGGSLPRDRVDLITPGSLIQAADARSSISAL